MSKNNIPDDIPSPTPWYRTQIGETVLSILFIGVTGVCWFASQQLSGLVAEVVAGIGVVALLLVILFSGRASEKAVAEVFDE